MIAPFDVRRKIVPRLSVSRFLTAACEHDAAAAEYSGDLFAAYLFWCHVTATRPVSQRSLGLELTKLEFTVIRHGKVQRKARVGLLIKACFTKREKPICLFPKLAKGCPRVCLVQQSRTIKADPCHVFGNRRIDLSHCSVSTETPETV